MNKRDLQNQKLDRIGRKLLETARVRNDEIENIVAAPQLFDSVQARIKAEQNGRKSKGFFGIRQNSQTWNLQRSFAVSAALAVLFFVALGIILFIKSPQQIEQVSAPQVEMKTESLEFDEETQFYEGSAEISVTKKNAIKTRKIVKQAKVEKANLKTPEPTQRPKSSKKQTPAETKAPSREFYALAYGAPIETGGDLQIIRAELPRSSVFALGVNIPIENESEKIKTDLLVGADGVARAIRFVD